MRKLRVRDLDEWPPPTGGAFAPGKMPRVSPGDAIVRTFIRKVGRNIRFGCWLEGTSYVYSYEAKTENIAEQLQSIIKNNLGKSLFSLGDFEIQEEITKK
jgi:hypothetical protein